jgi:hypothetical protein
MGSGKGHVFIIRVVLRKSHLVVDSLSRWVVGKGMFSSEEWYSENQSISLMMRGAYGL